MVVGGTWTDFNHDIDESHVLKRDDEMDSPNSDGDLVESCCLYHVDGSRVLSAPTLCKVLLRSVPEVEVHVCAPT